MMDAEWLGRRADEYPDWFVPVEEPTSYADVKRTNWFTSRTASGAGGLRELIRKRKFDDVTAPATPTPGPSLSPTLASGSLSSASIMSRNRSGSPEKRGSLHDTLNNFLAFPPTTAGTHLSGSATEPGPSRLPLAPSTVDDVFGFLGGACTGSTAEQRVEEVDGLEDLSQFAEQMQRDYGV
jgi:hypothetical protein